MTLRSRSWVIDLVAKHKSSELRCPATALILLTVSATDNNKTFDSIDSGLYSFNIYSRPTDSKASASKPTEKAAVPNHLQKLSAKPLGQVEETVSNLCNSRG